MKNVMSHKRKEQIELASQFKFPDSFTPLSGLFEHRKAISEQIMKNTNELQIKELNDLFDYANQKIKECLAL